MPARSPFEAFSSPLSERRFGFRLCQRWGLSRLAAVPRRWPSPNHLSSLIVSRDVRLGEH